MTSSDDLIRKVLEELKALRAELKLNSKALLTIEDTAAYLGLSPKSIRNRLGPRAEKPFPVKPVKIGGRVLFRLSDLDQFVSGL